MLISVCIPHYNRSRYLLAVLDSIRRQDHNEVEVIISDDCSTDDSSDVIPEYLASINGSSNILFTYIRQPKNLGYDGNVRAALGAGHGDYLLILGNDDCLANTHTLSDLASLLKQLNYPDTCYTNFFEYGFPHQVVRRARTTAVLGSGPQVAARTFRSFSFVGGVVFKRAAFEIHNTAKHDGSIYIQVYLASRIVAAGGTLASVSEAIVAKDFKIEGSPANSYMDDLASKNRRICRKTGGLDKFGEVACDAILPYIPRSWRNRYSVLIFGQILLFTYPFWLFTYRQHNAYRAAVNIALGCFPSYLTRHIRRTFYIEVLLTILYLPLTLGGLFFPLVLFRTFKESAFKLSKRLLHPVEATPIL
jgi:glycosyltransferase involved in cell wall biosynthesis